MGWRIGNRDSSHHARRIASAALFVFNRDREDPGLDCVMGSGEGAGSRRNRCRCVARRKLRMKFLQFHVVDGRGFARHAVMVHCVDAVRCQVHFIDSGAVFFRNRFNGNARRGQVFGQLTIVSRNINKFAQPLGKDSHDLVFSSRNLVSVTRHCRAHDAHAAGVSRAETHLASMGGEFPAAQFLGKKAPSGLSENSAAQIKPAPLSLYCLWLPLFEGRASALPLRIG